MAKKFLSKTIIKNITKRLKKKLSKILPSGLPKKRKKRNPFIPIRSSSPKEKRTLTDVKRHLIRVLAAKKAAKTRKENEAKLSPEEREKLRQKRREQFLKNIENKRTQSSDLSPEEDEQQKLKRSEAAKKAGKTRKENESKLSPEEREKLRSKRGDKFLKNISKKKNTQTNETPEDIEEQLAWEKFDNFVAEINQGYNRSACDFLIQCARDQANIFGIVDFMQAVEEKLNHDDLMIIIYADSVTDQVIISIQNVLEVIYSNSGISDFSFLLEQSIYAENLIYADIYSRKYGDIEEYMGAF